MMAWLSTFVLGGRERHWRKIIEGHAEYLTRHDRVRPPPSDQSILGTTELRKSPCTWFGEVCFCCSLTALPGPAWVLLKCVLQRLFLSSVIIHYLMVLGVKQDGTFKSWCPTLNYGDEARTLSCCRSLFHRRGRKLPKRELWGKWNRIECSA